MTESEARDSAPGTSPIVTTAQIEAVCIDRRLTAPKLIDAEAHGREILTSMGDDDMNDVDREALKLLGSILNMHFRPEDPASPYGPKFVMEGRRSQVPNDLPNEQIGELSAALPSIKHPGLRARIADVCWLQNRSDRACAVTAVAAYLESIEQVFSGSAEHEFNDKPGLDHRSIEMLTRAFQIANAIKGRGEAHSDEITDLTRRIVAHAETNQDPNLYCRALEVAFKFGIEEDADIGKRAEVACGWEPTNFHWAKHLLELATQAYRHARDEDAENRCLIAIAETSVKTAYSGDGSGMFRSSWLAKAINELRRARGPEARDRVKALQSELRDAQQDISFEMSAHTFELDLTDLANQTLNRVNGMSWSEVLAFIATLRFSNEPETLRSEAEEALSKSPLTAMMPGSVVDSEGKTVAKKPGGGSSSEETILAQVAEILQHSNHVFISGQWRPIRQGIQSDTSVDEEDFEVICANSAFVPAGFEGNFALGFARFFQGDMVSAVSILFPMLEASLRQVLKMAGHDPSKIEADMTQEDRGLSALLDRQRNALEAVFGAPIVFEIDMLFNHRLGPRMRHEQAHGKFSPEHCYSPNAQFACWFMYHLTCLPLLNDWEKIGPVIDELAKGRSARVENTKASQRPEDGGGNSNGKT